ncbi:MAG TPA: matrixin family metalloprotease [Polyangiaceae bacterium]
MRPWPVCAAGFLAVLAPAGLARAFCRTTTVHEPVPYDPVASGCWTQGTPLAWAAGSRVAYSLSAGASAQIPLADATRVADLAFETWNGASCAGNKPPDVQAFDQGPVSVDAAASDCGLQPCDPTFHDPQHVIVFDDAVWPHNDPNNTLALTTVTYGVNSGEIFDADVEINSKEHTLSAQEPAPQGAFDLQSILTHEAGHFFGLAHATDSHPIMFAQYQPGAVALTTDDVDGICSIYPAPPKSGCACTTAPPGTGGLALASGLSLVGLAALRKRRRPSR